MPPRRSVRRNSNAYKKGDFVEYQYKGSTVTGKLVLKIKSGADAKPAWIVTPSDRRRKNEEIPESALGKIINAQGAITSRGPKIKRSSDSTRQSSPTSLSNTSDGSSDDTPKRRSGRGSPRSDENSDDGGSSTNNNGKRKVDDAHNISVNDRSKKTQKTVTFSQESDVTTSSKTKATKASNANTSARIVTRSTRGSGEVGLLPELPMKKKVAKGKKIAKDDNVTVVKMLTGTLYLYRGDRPRAEFVRYK